MISHLARVVTSLILIMTPEVGVDLDQRGASRRASRRLTPLSVALGLGLVVCSSRARWSRGPPHLVLLGSPSSRVVFIADHAARPDHLPVDRAAVLAD